MFRGLFFGRSFYEWGDINHYHPVSDQQSNAIEFLKDWFAGRKNFALHTSGSTGKPKIIHASRESMILSAEKTIDYFGLNDSDHALVTLNTAYIAGKMMLVRAIEANMQLTVVEPSRVPDQVNSKATFTAVVPLQLEAILDAGLPLEHFKCILVGGAPLSEKLRQRLSNLALNIYETYGMTETLSHIAVRLVAGKNAASTFTCIHELDLETDQRDCLRIRGKLTQGEWLQTNDRVRLLGRKKFEWLGRADWTINSGGIKLQPEEVEKQISKVAMSRGWSANFFIYGFDHQEFGEAAVLIFEGEPPASEEQIIQELSSTLNPYEVPKAIRYVPQFRRGSTNKLLRKETASLLLPFSF